MKSTAFRTISNSGNYSCIRAYVDLSGNVYWATGLVFRSSHLGNVNLQGGFGVLYYGFMVTCFSLWSLVRGLEHQERWVTIFAQVYFTALAFLCPAESI